MTLRKATYKEHSTTDYYRVPLKRLRLMMGLTMQEVADNVNVSRQAVHKWECGSVPTDRNLAKLADLYGYDFDYLKHQVKKG